MLKKHSKIFLLSLGIYDATIICTSFVLAFYLRFYSGWFEVTTIPDLNVYFSLLGFVVPVWLIVFAALRLYQPRRTSSVFIDGSPLFLGNVLGILGLCSLSFFYREHSYSRLTFVLFGISNFTLLFLSRIAIRGTLKWLRLRGFNKRRVLIVGAGQLGFKVAKSFLDHGSYGYEVLGFLDDLHSNGKYKEYGLDILGRTSRLKNVLETRDVDRVIIALPNRAQRKIQRIVGTCEEEGIETDIVPDLFQVVQPTTKVANFNGIPIVSVRKTPVDTWSYRVLKRLFDIVFSLFVLVVTLPLLLTIAAVIKLNSPGPVFFKQERIGRKRKPFMMYKFRTMQVMPKEESDTVWTLETDSRRTVFGAFLRKTSLDELPQFLNVLKGEMSVVGPRPERPYFAKHFKTSIPKYMVRHQIWTGITGLAQVNGWRGDTSIKKRLEHDLFYLENWSLWLDFKIILKTLFSGFVNKNAY